MPGPKRGSGTRSNIYSSSKYSNWSPYDPFCLEIRALPEGLRAAAQVQVGPEAFVPVINRPLKPGFLLPVTIDDVAALLERVPSDFLKGLAGVYLLGGTAKQARSRLVRYGTYYRNSVYLHPLPKKRPDVVYAHMPKPSVAREYTKFGAEFVQRNGVWLLEFTGIALRKFYLYDVLLHEIGHHVEHRMRRNPGKASERYATWFAEEQERALAQRGPRSSGKTG